MTKLKFTVLLPVWIIMILKSQATVAQSPAEKVSVIGAMRNVMWQGKLQGIIQLDTISDKQHLYGLGPVEYLSGELLIADGKSYRSTVLTDTTMKVEETFAVKAPFFVYTNVGKWTMQPLPDSVQTIVQLEQYLDLHTRNFKRPFAFRLSAITERATIHIVDLPAGTIVSSPEDAHMGQKKYYLHNEPSEIIGFFSTEHQSVFTHHDTFLHMHLITEDRSKMGHLEDMLLKRGTVKLYLPQQ